MDDVFLIEWDRAFEEPPSAELPQFAAYCINWAEDAIKDGEDARETLINAIGQVAAFACGIADDDMNAWMLMIGYGAHRMRHA